MGNRLFKRACKVTVYQTAPVGFVGANSQFFEQQPNAIEITGLRVQFKVDKSLDSTPNSATVTITNAATHTRATLQTKPLVVDLQAGHDDTLRHVFTGDLRDGRSVLDGVDWSTILQLGDGERAYRAARTSRSYKAGTTVATALKDAADAMGLQLPSDVVASSDLQAQFATGRSLHGPARDELTRLLAPFGYHWSVQDGRLQILKDQDPTNGAALTLDQSSGMIGAPVFGSPEKNGAPAQLHVKALLYPELTPGCLVDVSSSQIEGVFRVTKVTHAGDTHGDDWTTDIEATPSQAKRT
jgi:hypothetical protein